jgi:hypothetical protein
MALEIGLVSIWNSNNPCRNRSGFRSLIKMKSFQKSDGES